MDESPSRDATSHVESPQTDRARAALTEPGPSRLPAGVGVYAGAAGLFTAIPVPILDGLLSGLARGAAMRRVAMRHGVRLSPEGRRVLARTEARAGSGLSGTRVLRAVALRALKPVRVLSRFEDMFSVLAAAHLFDHYLSTSDRGGGPLGRDEAERLRRAMDRSARAAALDTARGVPMTLLEALRDAARAAVTVDDEDRSPVERTVDAFLDRLSEAQSDSLVTLRDAFDRETGKGDAR